MNVTTDYSGRQVDLELLQTIKTPAGVVSVVIDNVSDDTARKVSGIQKSVQRYAQLLLTGIGDVRFATGRGGPLARAIASGVVGNLGYLSHLFVVSSLAAIETLTKEDGDTETFGAIPDDERIVSADLEDISIDSSTASAAVSVKITTAAGESYDYVIPVTA